MTELSDRNRLILEERAARHEAGIRMGCRMALARADNPDNAASRPRSIGSVPNIMPVTPSLAVSKPWHPSWAPDMPTIYSTLVRTRRTIQGYGTLNEQEFGLKPRSVGKSPVLGAGPVTITADDEHHIATIFSWLESVRRS